MRTCIKATVFILLLAACAHSQDAATDQKALQGKWSLTSGEAAGQPFPEAQLKSISLVITGAKYAVKVGDKTDLGTVKLDPATKPKAMDIVGTDGPNKGKTLLAIYEINGDTLRICYDLTGKARPTEFKTSKDAPHFLATYQRAKP
jgi:uncharacterized protein (TIGR03067 family)